MASLRRHVLPVSGILSEVYAIQASSGPARLQVLLILGNPGSAQYYVMQMQMLHQAMGGQVDIMAISHAGHDGVINQNFGGKTLWSLHDQIQHKADFIRQYMLLPGRPPLVVAAHSIGAYIAVHAVREVEQNDSYLMRSESLRPPILKVIAMFPFLWMDGTQMRIHLLSIAAARYEVMGRVAQLLSWLPSWLRLAVVRHFTRGSMDKEAADVTQRLLVRSSVRNNFYMAHTEFRDLNRPPPWELLSSFGKRLHVLGCPEDIWMTKAQYQELQDNLSGMQATWVEGVHHAYCTSRAQCERVNVVVSNIISEVGSQHEQLAQPFGMSYAVVGDASTAVRVTGGAGMEVGKEGESDYGIQLQDSGATEVMEANDLAKSKI